MPAPITAIVATVEIAFFLGGLALLWRFVFHPAERRERAAALPTWEIGPTDFLLFLCLVCSGMFVVGTGAATLGRAQGLAGTEATILAGAGAQFGLLLGFALFHFAAGRKFAVPAPRRGSILMAGAATFLVSLPIMAAVSFVWRRFLQMAGLPTESQSLVGMFAQADSPALLALMIGLAVLVAPLAEELVFRAGCFRYLRTRLPRQVALLLPAIVFAALHGNYASFAPLVALAMIFSLAYERTGQIGTTIVAHALFNLNTVMVIFSGMDRLG